MELNQVYTTTKIDQTILINIGASSSYCATITNIAKLEMCLMVTLGKQQRPLNLCPHDALPAAAKANPSTFYIDKNMAKAAAAYPPSSG